MNHQLFAFGLLTIIAAAVSAPAPLLTAPASERIEGNYIVVLKQRVSSVALQQHIKKLSQSNDGSSLLFAYDMPGFRGFSGNLSLPYLSQLRNHPDVDYIEEDRIMRVAQSCSRQQDAEWGLDRISERDLNIDGNYVFPSQSGAGVDVYIIDTGIQITHNEFQGRATWGANYADTDNTDCNGHGTHVAGTVGGATYGVAKKANLIAVKVLSCDGSGSNSGVIAGINYVTQQAKSSGRPSVANMSLGGGRSTAIDSAVTQSVAAGVIYAVAAGNENTDACTKSPAAVPTAITVGATTIGEEFGVETDERASFSNFGTCVTLFAPGQLIKSAWIGADTAVKTISGTSMASPHVAGAAAVYVSNNPTAKPAAVKSFFDTQTTKGTIDLICTSATCNKSPNKLLYSPCS